MEKNMEKIYIYIYMDYIIGIRGNILGLYWENGK